MRLILTKDFGAHRAGRVLTPGDGMGNLLIKRGFARLAPIESLEEPPEEPIKVEAKVEAKEPKPKPKKKNAPPTLQPSASTSD